MGLSKILPLFLVLELVFSNFSFVLAQDATESGALVESATSTPEPTPFETPIESPSPSPEFSSLPTSETSPNFETSLPDSTVFETFEHEATVSASSAEIKQPVRVRSLSKHDFRADEDITVVVENTLSAGTKITLFSSDGIEVLVDVEIVSDYDPSVYKILPPNQLRPGRYRIKITDPEGTVTTQDFTWGVLAINPDKSIYLPNESSHLSIAVLDETGQMVCDADVTLKIKKIPFGEDFSVSEEELSTQNGKITVNPECLRKDFFLTPDYEAAYQVGEPGTYKLDLTAQTKNGTYSIDDSFEVRQNISFDIKRTSATRIFPPKTYPMTVEVTANEDFEGNIKEVVPGNFAVYPLEGTNNFDSLESVLSAQVENLNSEASIPTLTPPFDQMQPISLRFGEQLRDPLLKQKYADFGLLGHDGIDFDMIEGTPVLAVDSGEVVRVRENGDYGATVVIQHPWGRSYYGHLSLITAQEGNKIEKGHPLGLSGSTGLSTGPHLHFGVKPNDNDMTNGYYGKINPLPYIAFREGNQDVLGERTNAKPLVSPSFSENQSSQVISWNVSLKKGDRLKLGYSYKVPNISPQFYLLGPLEFKDKGDKRVFQEGRRWQLAIDIDGSGTNTVDPTSGVKDATGRTYAFTFNTDDTEVNYDSGGISITVPSGWTAPQSSNASNPGYTTAVGSTSGTAARVLNNANATTNWNDDGDTDFCQAFPVLDTTIKQEGTGSIKCDTNGGTPDNNDSFSYDFTAENWTDYSEIAVWVRSDDGTSAGDLRVGYDDTNTCASVLQTFSVPALTLQTWTYVKNTMSVARTSVTAVCFLSNASGLDGDIIWVDDVLIGPLKVGDLSITGSGPWDINVRFLDLGDADTMVVTYGSGGGASGVTNPSTVQTYTFTTKSRISDAGTLQPIGSSPTVDITEPPAGPTTGQQMRHGNWFNASGVEQSFTF